MATKTLILYRLLRSVSPLHSLNYEGYDIRGWVNPSWCHESQLLVQLDDYKQLSQSSMIFCLIKLLRFQQKPHTFLLFLIFSVSLLSNARHNVLGSPGASVRDWDLWQWPRNCRHRSNPHPECSTALQLPNWQWAFFMSSPNTHHCMDGGCILSLNYFFLLH